MLLLQKDLHYEQAFYTLCALYPVRITIYYNSSEEVSFYLLAYSEVCTEAHTELMFDLDDLGEYLADLPYFNERGVDATKLEYRRILVVGEDIDDEETEHADILHAIYSYQYQKLLWLSVEGDKLTYVEIQE